ncbi:Sec-independent protein translocase protein TatA [Brevundimonas sp. NIBR11]|nr:Sec-independent protein translocase protein TatA [Brevundimonas sp. NIBR11]
MTRVAFGPFEETVSVGSFSIWHWAIVIVVAALLFGGKGKISGLMGDAAKGIKAFREGLKDDDKAGPSEGVSSLPRTDAEKEELKR